MATNFNIGAQNRYYFRPKWFVGLHGSVNLNYRYASYSSQSNFIQSDGVLPILSIGNGRIESVQYARNAVDIEKQLKIGDRLIADYSEEELRVIANKLAEINNVRFYDFRLRRIEQFKALDAVMREVGRISEFDMTYFVHLADAYLYAKNFQRFSGFRHEIGASPVAGFYNMSYELPISYAFQHAVNANTTGSILSSGFGVPEDLKLLVTASGGYEFGWCPTTRTNLNIGTQVGTALNDFTVGGQVYLSGDVYFSPRFRLNFNASLNIGNGDASPNMDYMLRGLDLTQDGHQFSTQVRLSYAIF